ncbi:unnamed protein product [Ectocarpus fasciculatus]
MLMSRKEYVFLFEKLAAAAAGAGAEDAHANASTKVGSSPSLSPPLTPREHRRLDELEEELPLQTILMFRTMARKEIKRKRDAERAKMSPQEVAALAARNSGRGGWWGSFWGRANTKKEDGDLALQDLTASFGHDVEANKPRGQLLSCSVVRHVFPGVKHISGVAADAVLRTPGIRLL